MNHRIDPPDCGCTDCLTGWSRPARDEAEYVADHWRLGWWAISGAEFLRALHLVADGADPNLVYAEFYANSEVERHDAD